MLDIKEEVYHAIINKRAVVALESTIITHGMPHPENLKTAVEVENIVREQVGG
jgi:pseudouridylate synthase